MPDRKAVTEVLSNVRETFSEDSSRWCKHTQARTASGEETVPFEELTHGSDVPVRWSLDGAVEAEALTLACGTLRLGLREAHELNVAAINALSEVITPPVAIDPVANVDLWNDACASRDEVVATLDRAIERLGQVETGSKATVEQARRRGASASRGDPT